MSIEEFQSKVGLIAEVIKSSLESFNLYIAVDPIKLTSKQYEALKKRLGEKIDESDKDRLISNSLGRQVIIVD